MFKRFTRSSSFLSQCRLDCRLLEPCLPLGLWICPVLWFACLDCLTWFWTVSASVQQLLHSLFANRQLIQFHLLSLHLSCSLVFPLFPDITSCGWKPELVDLASDLIWIKNFKGFAWMYKNVGKMSMKKPRTGETGAGTERGWRAAKGHRLESNLCCCSKDSALCLCGA